MVLFVSQVSFGLLVDRLFFFIVPEFFMEIRYLADDKLFDSRIINTLVIFYQLVHGDTERYGVGQFFIFEEAGFIQLKQRVTDQITLLQKTLQVIQCIMLEMFERGSDGEYF